MDQGFFLSSMMGITDGVFCAQRSEGCTMVQLGAYLAEPTANKQDKGNQARSFLPADWGECVHFLRRECENARRINNVAVCLNLATPKIEWGLLAAECFQQAGGDYIELNAHGGYQRYLDQGKLRAMILPENQLELYHWIEALSILPIPLIVKFNGQFERAHLLNVLEKIKTYNLFGIHINIRNPAAKRPDFALTKHVRAIHAGVLLASGYVRSTADAVTLFAIGVDMVGIAEPTMNDAGYIERIARAYRNQD
jgi:tRNA-dihydrouridine synthase